MTNIASPSSLSTRRIQKSPLIRAEILQQATLMVLIVLAMACILWQIIAGVKLQHYADGLASGEYRTEEEMINGGKRFIDMFYSINAPSVRFDRYRALKMVLNTSRVEKEIEYLKREDFIRKTEISGVRSEIDWTRTEVKIVGDSEADRGYSYKGFILFNNKLRVPFHIVLSLSPVKITNDNSTGVGIVNWVDVAEQPFEVGHEATKKN